MNSDEYTKFKVTSGQYAYRELTKLTDSAEYKKMTDAQKADAVSEVYSSAAEKAKTTIMDNRGEMRLPTSADGKKVQSYVDTAGVSEKQAYTLYNKIKALKPASGKDQVSDYQKIGTIMSQLLSEKQTTALVSTFYTTREKDGTIKKESLLPYLNNTVGLLALYLNTQDGQYINMTVPEEFKRNSKTYTLTDAAKKVYAETYARVFNNTTASIHWGVANNKQLDIIIKAAKSRAENMAEIKAITA
jgi:hypothetical protein